MRAGRDSTLWVIDPSINNPEHEAVNLILEDWPGTARVFRPVMSPGDGPDPATGYQAGGIVLMGSAASVHDSLPWLDGLSAWLDPILGGAVRLPLLGICFGHQLIAHRAGGRVGFLRDDRSKRLGVESSELSGGRLLPGRHELRVVVSHREAVTAPPPRYRMVARRPGVDIDGLEHAELPLFSFQFHPEAGMEFAGHVGLDPGLLEPRVGADSRKLLGAFRRAVLDSLR